MSKDTVSAFGIALPTGFVYNIHWKEGIDWKQVLIQPSKLWQESD